MSKSSLTSVSLKFIDIMVGVILGLGFQWWPSLVEPWQYLAFIFAYVDIVDYWIDYSPSLKKYPPKKEFDIFIDMVIMFSIFLYVYSTQLTIERFLLAYVLFSIVDIIWLYRAQYEHAPNRMASKKKEHAFLATWLKFNTIQAGYTLGLVIFSLFVPVASFALLSVFVVLRIVTRVLASLGYKKVYLA